MRAREFINEDADAVRRQLQKDWMPQGYIPPAEYRGKNISLPRDEQGRPIEPGLEQPAVSPEDLLMPLAGVGRKIIQGTAATARNSLGKRVYDLANKPNPYNPLTAKHIGSTKGTAEYHADKAFRKEFGRNPPNWLDGPDVLPQWGGRDAYRQASKRYADISNDFLQRGYAYRPLQDIPTIPDSLPKPKLDPRQARSQQLTPQEIWDQTKNVVNKSVDKSNVPLGIDAANNFKNYAQDWSANKKDQSKK
jgi:hypothetical protein